MINIQATQAPLDSELVIEARTGNQLAFAELVERYQNLLTSIAFSRTGDVQRSEDLAQQAFLIAWQKLDELREPERFGSWIRGITRHLSQNAQRQANRLAQISNELTPAEEPFRRESPAETLATQEQQQLLWATLKNIPEEYREPLILFYREEKSVVQVAERLGLSVDAVKQRLARGRAMLKSEVEHFVEELLGVTKPGRSFSASILLALPSTSPTVGKVILHTSLGSGAKAMLGKLTLLATGSVLGIAGGLLGGAIGATGGWYGTKAADKLATSEAERRLLWRFYWVLLGETTLLTLASVIAAVWLPSGRSLTAYVLGSTTIYALLLTMQITRFVHLQRSLHAIHGKPAYPSKLGDGRPTSARSFARAIISSSIGCWTWLFILAAIQRNALVLGAATVAMLADTTLCLVRAHQPNTLPEQLRFQARAIMGHMLLSGLLLFGAGYVGMLFEPIPNWTIMVFVWMVGGLGNLAVSYAARKAEAAG